MSNRNTEKHEVPNDAQGSSAHNESLSENPTDRNLGTTGTTSIRDTTPPPKQGKLKHNGDDEENDTLVIDSDEGENMGEEEEDDEEDERIDSTPQRKKRTRRVYNGMIECNVEPIRSLLTCTLCEGLYREPYTTLKCFHTFCKSCLITAIRASYNTPQYNCCPICQTYFGRDDIVTNNALPDRVLETLIDKVLFPHLSYQDHLFECEFYHKRGIQQKENISTTSTSMKGLVTKTNSGSEAVTSKVPVVGSNEDEVTTKYRNHMKESLQQPPPRTVHLTNDKDQMIVFQLVPLLGIESVPKLPPLPFPFLKTSAQLRIEQIKKLLVMKLFPDSIQTTTDNDHRQGKRHEFEIYCHGCLLEDELTLNFISHVIWGVDSNNVKSDSNGNHSTGSTNNEKTPTLTLEYKYIINEDQENSDKNKAGTKD